MSGKISIFSIVPHWIITNKIQRLRRVSLKRLKELQLTVKVLQLLLHHGELRLADDDDSGKSDGMQLTASGGDNLAKTLQFVERNNQRFCKPIAGCSKILLAPVRCCRRCQETKAKTGVARKGFGVGMNATAKLGQVIPKRVVEESLNNIDTLHCNLTEQARLRFNLHNQNFKGQNLSKT